MRTFSLFWNSSKKPRKQRKYRAKAPLHIKRLFLSAPLGKELRAKLGRKSSPIITGDDVKILRGQFKSVLGKVERVSYKKSKIYIRGAEVAKKDGSKSFYPIDASNVQIISNSKRKNGKKSSKTDNSSKKLENK